MRFSIRWALIFGFLALIWGTSLITTTSMYVSSEKVLKQHARDIMENIANLAKEQSQNHLAHAQAAAVLTRRLLNANVVGIDGNNADKLERYFLDQLAISPHFAGIYLGKPNGDFYYVSRNSQQPGAYFRTKIILNDSGGRSTRLLWRDAELNLVADVLEATWRSERHPSIIQLNLDRFKNINDSLGHYDANQVLIAVGKRLEALVVEWVDILASGLHILHGSGVGSGRRFRNPRRRSATVTATILA